VKLVWEGGKPEFYEMTTFHQELPEEPAKPAPATSKGDEPALVVEVPEYKETARPQDTPTEENLKDSVDKVDGDKMSSGNSDVETTVEKSDEFASASVKTDQAQKQEQPQTLVVKDQLPATGGEESATLALLGGLGLVLSAVFVKKGKKD